MMRAVIALAAAIAGLFLIGLSLGDYAISSHDLALALVGDRDAPPQASMMIWTVRMPRLLLALLVGLALAVSGVIAQAVMRNPLADPGLLGINSGAALAAMIVMVGHGRRAGSSILPLASFGGADADGDRHLRAVLA